MESPVPGPKVPFYERGLFWGLASLAVAVVLTAAGLIVPPTTFAKWLLVVGWLLSIIPLWLVFDAITYKAATFFLTIVCSALIALGMNVVWGMRQIPSAIAKPLEVVMLPPTPLPQSKSLSPTPKGILPPLTSVPVVTTTTPKSKPKRGSPEPQEPYPIVLLLQSPVTRDAETHKLTVTFNFSNTTTSEANVKIAIGGTWTINGSLGPQVNGLSRDIGLGPPSNSYSLSATFPLTSDLDQLYMSSKMFLTVVGQASYPDRGSTTIYHFEGVISHDWDHMDMTKSEWERVSAPQ
jgi:hypothetical protein